MNRIVKILLSVPTVLFLANLLITTLVEGKREVESNTVYIAVLVGIWLLYIGRNLYTKNIVKKSFNDIITVIYIVFLAIELSTRVFDSLNKTLFPAMEDVAFIFAKDYQMMLLNILSSLEILVIGYGIALVLGNFLGLIIGYNDRLRELFFPIAKVVSPIPPMVYTPYLIAILPNFNMASISVIAFGLFWPIFMNMIIRIEGMEKRILDSARTLNVDTPTMLFKIILPYSLPGIIKSIRVQFSVTFMILVMAEMIGAKSGLGFYVKKFSDYIDFTRVFAGIILIGFVIAVANSFLQKLENRLIKWKPV